MLLTTTGRWLTCLQVRKRRCGEAESRAPVAPQSGSPGGRGGPASQARLWGRSGKALAMVPWTPADTGMRHRNAPPPAHRSGAAQTPGEPPFLSVEFCGLTSLGPRASWVASISRSQKGEKMQPGRGACAPQGLGRKGCFPPCLGPRQRRCRPPVPRACRGLWWPDAPDTSCPWGRRGCLGDPAQAHSRQPLSSKVRLTEWWP